MNDGPTSTARPDAADRERMDAGGDVRLPGESLRRLSRLCGELGGGSIAALRDVGRTAGRRLVGDVRGDGSGEMSLDRFWAELAEAAAGAGFGRVEYRVLDRDVGEVELTGSPEAAPSDGEGGLSPHGCHFACGWIGGALSAAAGEPVAVLEVECAAGGGEDSCRFLVGPRRRLEEVRTSLRSGAETLAAAPGEH